MTIELKPESESKCNKFNSPVKDQLAELLNRGALVQTIKRAIDDGGVPDSLATGLDTVTSAGRRERGNV